MVATHFEELEAEALKLGVAERARLAEHLIASLDEDSEIDEAWAVEIERRIESLDKDSVDLVPAAEAVARTRAALR